VLGHLYFGAVVLVGLDLAEGLLAGGFGFQPAGVGIAFEFTSPDVGVLADLLGVDDGGGEGLPAGSGSFPWVSRISAGSTPRARTWLSSSARCRGPALGSTWALPHFSARSSWEAGVCVDWAGLAAAAAYSASCSAVMCE